MIHTRNDPLHVALIWADDGPRLLTAAPTREAVLERVAGYVSVYAPHQLGPEDAACVAELLDGGSHGDAIRHYFEADRRWDEEQRHLTVVDAVGSADPLPTGSVALPFELAEPRAG
jgi:hypothetical protein